MLDSRADCGIVRLRITGTYPQHHNRCFSRSGTFPVIPRGGRASAREDRAMQKKCMKCGEVKALSEFYVHKQMRDGHLNKCKKCTCLDIRMARRFRGARARTYDLERAKTPKRKALVARGQRRRRKQHPEKTRAYSKVHRAKAAGKMARADQCQQCATTGRTEDHHPDYSKPFDVIALCPLCHRRLDLSVPL